MGEIKDIRDHNNSPSINNFLKKSSEELKSLLLLAIENQIKELKAEEGDNAITLKLLEHEYEAVKSFNANKSEKEVKCTIL